jgi:hypothetical protein
LGGEWIWPGGRSACGAATLGAATFGAAGSEPGPGAGAQPEARATAGGSTAAAPGRRRLGTGTGTGPGSGAFDHCSAASGTKPCTCTELGDLRAGTDPPAPACLCPGA